MYVVAHRGASRARVENTPSAFATAEEMGADAVELDVRLAADGREPGRLLVFHDPLPSAPDALAAISGLDDVLDACGERMLINVEIKNSAGEGGFDPTMAVVAPTIDALRRRGPSWARRWLISSFSLRTIDHCRKVAPAIPTALLVEEPTDRAIAAAADRGHRAIHPWVEALDAGRVEACHRAGLAVTTWTCNDPERIVELAALGVDAVCTDVPDVALAALGRDRVTDPVLTPEWGRRA